MRHFICCLLLILTFPVEAKLLLVGGGRRPVEGLKEFLIASGGEKASIVIIPWASESVDGSNQIKTELQSIIKSKVQVAQMNLDEQELSEFMNQLNSVTGIFFAGGDQNQLMAMIKKYQLNEYFKNLFLKGVIFAGTSAGTAIMSQVMLTGESDLTVIDSKSTKLSSGLGLLAKGVIIDQHFVKRMRFNRLAGLILDGFGNLGIGVDENTALWIDNSVMKISGEGSVILMKSRTFNSMDLKILKSGDEIELNKDEFFTSGLLIY